MTGRRRSRRTRQRGSPAETRSGQATSPARLAELIRGELHRRGADLAPLHQLASRLRVPQASVRAAAARSTELGLCGPGRRPLVWWADPAALAAGFEPVYRRGRLTLQLPAAERSRRPLVISGRHNDPAAQVDLDPTELKLADPIAGRLGELGYTVARLTAMAGRWLADDQQLFALVRLAWQASPTLAWTVGSMQVHVADLGQPVATVFWRDNIPTSHVELVVWADPDDGLVLANVYPVEPEAPTL